MARTSLPTTPSQISSESAKEYTCYTAHETARLSDDKARGPRPGRCHVAPSTWSSRVVVLTEDLNLVAVTPEAEHLISLIEPDGPNRLPMPTAIYAVAAALQAVERGGRDASGVPSTPLATRAGTSLMLPAARLNGHADPNQLVAILEPVEPRTMVPLMLSAYGLSTREAQIATLVLRGRTTHAIGNTLHISPNTVQDHLKSVFDLSSTRPESAAVVSSSA